MGASEADGVTVFVVQNEYDRRYYDGQGWTHESDLAMYVRVREDAVRLAAAAARSGSYARELVRVKEAYLNCERECDLAVVALETDGSSLFVHSGDVLFCVNCYRLHYHVTDGPVNARPPRRIRFDPNYLPRGPLPPEEAARHRAVIERWMTRQQRVEA